MDLIIKTAKWYAVTIAITAFVIWIGPGFRDLNGQLAFLFCLVAGLPLAAQLAKT
ncbi:MAG TPA: hypothetical protein VGC86_04160 [Afipia sp.]